MNEPEIEKSKKKKLVRPPLTSKIDIDDFRSFYWLKMELTDFCVKNGIKTNGRKPEIFDRIEYFLQYGKIKNERINPHNKTKVEDNSDDTPLSLATVFKEGFKFNQRNRDFFKSVLGPHFHFTVHTAKYVRDNLKNGNTITYQDFVDEWLKEKKRRKNKNFKPEIMASCEYNQFIRDYFLDNKDKKFKDAVNAWNKIKKKRGSRKYVSNRNSSS